MAFSVFQAQTSPIAIDFGSSSVKLLQLTLGERNSIAAAAELPIPEAIRSDRDKLMNYYAEYLPALISEGRFKGRRAVIALPSSRTFIQHMPCSDIDGMSRLDVIKAQLQTKIGTAPDGLVVRYRDVEGVAPGGQQRREVICLAIVRDLVMQYVELLRRQKINVVGVHPETLALTNAFSHLVQDEADRSMTTMFVDMGWAGAQVAICHGEHLTFARYVPIGGRHFDQRIATELHCDLMTARSQRITMGEQARRAQPSRGRTGVLETALLNAASDAWSAGAGCGTTPTEPGTSAQSMITTRIDLTELIDAVSDELAGCIRYHATILPDRRVDRLIFVGGESRQLWLVRAIAESLGIPAFLGDPLLRLNTETTGPTPGVELREPQPGWTVVAGLCTAPTDL